MAEELSGVTPDELHEIDANNEGSDDENDDDDEIDFNLVVKKFVITQWVDQSRKLTEGKWWRWNKPNACDIIEALAEKKKAESEERKDTTNDYPTDILTSSFPTALNHVIYTPKAVFNE